MATETATVTLKTIGHRHVQTGACYGDGRPHVALGTYGDTDSCAIRVERIYRNGAYSKTTHRLYCIDCAVRLGFDTGARRCERN